VSGIAINEVSVSPSDVLDEQGDAEDWIELYNASAQAVNLAGLYMTDDGAQKKKFKIAAGSGDEMLLGPGAYKIFYADDETNEGADHLNFKLSNDGEMVGLYQEVDGTMYKIDAMSYSAQHATGSFSRLPNATGPFAFTSALTPGAANVLVTGIEKEERIGAYPNPVSSVLHLKMSGRIDRAQLIDCYGQVVRQYAELSTEEALPVHDIKPGIYLLRVRVSNRWQTIKIVKQ
jgi:hypothetical protein